MQGLSQLIVRLLELLEAEGRLAQRNFVRAVMGAAVIVAAGTLGAVGTLCLGAAGLLGLLAAGLHPAVACLILGLALVLLALMLAGVGRLVGGPRR